MKLGKNIILILIMMLFLAKFGNNNKHYNLIVYLIFTFIIGTKIIFNIVKAYRVKKKGKILKGRIVTNSNNSMVINGDKTNVFAIVFCSPIDKKEYQIKTEIENFPDDGFVYVLFNEKNPENSKVFEKYNILENLSLLFAFIGFLYFIIFRNK